MNEQGLCKFLGITKDRLEFLYKIGIPHKIADNGRVFNERDVLVWLQKKAP